VARRPTAPERQAAEERRERAAAFPQRAAQQAAVLRVVVKAAQLATVLGVKGLRRPRVPQAAVAVVVR
jgi:hypothetical protein